MKTLRHLLIASSVIAALCAEAKVTLPNYITDNMLVQQNSTLKVKGYAQPGSNVTVLAGWASKSIDTKADKTGRFEVAIDTPAAGGPYSIVFKDNEGSVVIENVLSGEVWLCSGQSNMEFPVQGWATLMDYEREVATAYYPDIRLLQVKKTISYSPKDDVEVNNGGWQICTSASMADFSAIAFLFAKEISTRLGIPVGVIDTTWGGTPAEAWTSAEALGAISGFETELNDLKAADYNADKLAEIYSRKNEEWMALANSSKVDFDKGKLQSSSDWHSIQCPGYWESSELPGFDGIVWLQKSINIPADMVGSDLTISLRAIDDEDVTYFNGQQVGIGSGYDTPRTYVVPAENVREGENIITIRVSDFGGEGGLMTGYANVSAAGKTIDISGEWQYMIGADFAKLPTRPVSPYSSSYPTVLYNAMLSPLQDMPIKGVLWYQGCANVGRDEQYKPLFKALINDWRSIWGEEMPFYFVQLAGFMQHQPVQPNSQWAALRNAQASALELDNTGMAVAIDLGNPVDIHPKNKQDVAHRLALIALARNYGIDEVYEAPKCVSAVADGSSIVLTFDKPVQSKSVAINGFIIAGKDGAFTTATPKFESDKVIRVSAPGVSAPVSVRYNWADFPSGNLYGETGLPVAPFANDK